MERVGKIQSGRKELPLKLTLIFLLLIILAFGWFYRYTNESFLQFQKQTQQIVQFYYIWGGFIVFYLLYRFVLMLLYKPIPPSSDFRPSISIVIPAYNEGKTVKRAIVSAIKADYYEGMKEVFCIDDGSTDDTWNYIEEAQKQYPGQFVAIKTPQNKGKRHALAIGFRRAIGEIVVTLDSDSEIMPDSLYHLVAPFKQPNVGATTGKIKVTNRDTNFLTRMVSVRYTMAFDFFRATWSTFGTVFCCSGVLSAYRRSLLMEILPDFENQTFLGERCTYGDDRALTNLVLKKGLNTLYTKNAVVQTLVPENVKKLFKMITRWNKSFIRESVVLAGFIFTRYREKNRLLPIIDYTMLIIMVPIQFLLVMKSIAFVIYAPLTLLPFLTTIATMGLVYMLFYIKLERNLDFIYGVFYSIFFTLILIWALPYAALTMKDGSWLTR
jgi:hyaluronan synthase